MQYEPRPGLKISKLLMVLIIITVSIVFVSNALQTHRQTSQRRITIQRMGAIEEGLEKYLIDSGGVLPSGKQGLQALLEEPQTNPRPRLWDGPYVSGPEVLKDAWERDFHYICRGKPVPGYKGLYYPYSLWSYGRDGREGGEDLDADICSWDRTTMIP